jgi:hypothetical protein
MKWFSHDNDLSKSPRMQAVIADRGLEGYGQALVLLETLARETKNDGTFQFIVPLQKPTDIRFWTRELGTESDRQTEKLFDVFEAADLIMPWRNSRAICAPMLGERADEWSKRKSKVRSKVKGSVAPENENEQEDGNKDEHRDGNEHQHQHKHKSGDLPSDSRVAPESSREDSNPVDAADVGLSLTADKARTSGQDLSDTEIVVEFRKIAKDHVGKIEVNDRHKKEAVEYFRKWGKKVALISWSRWLSDRENLFPKHANGEPVAWPIHSFLSTGDGEMLAEETKLFVDAGLENPSVVSFVAGMWESDELNLAPQQFAVLNRFQGDVDRSFHQYVNSGTDDSPAGFVAFLEQSAIAAVQ